MQNNFQTMMESLKKFNATELIELLIESKTGDRNFSDKLPFVVLDDAILALEVLYEFLLPET